jgi:Fic/DOC family/Transposase DDE domain
MDAFFSLIHENWTIVDHPTALAAFALWNLNYIHPFIEGNGRTARAACYYLICMKQRKIPGLCARRIIPFLAKRNTEHGTGLGRWRWVVERTFAWLNQFRRLRVRYERRADIHEAFLALGCVLICWRLLDRCDSELRPQLQPHS